MPRRSRTTCTIAALVISFIGADTFLGFEAAAATDDAVRNQLASKGCVRGKFKDFYLQGKGGDPPASYTGRVCKLSQNYPKLLPPMEGYPWLKIGFKNGGPIDPRAYLHAFLDYGLEGNVEAGFYVEDNKVRKWHGMPWMDWNTEVASDWPGADFSDSQLYSSDYSQQLSMSLQNFMSLRCAKKPQKAAEPQPAVCEQLFHWSKAQRKSIDDLLTIGSSGRNGAPIPSGSQGERQ